MMRTGRTAIALTLLLAGSAFAQQQPTAPPAAAPPPVDFSKVEIKTTDLGDNVYMSDFASGSKREMFCATEPANNSTSCGR